MWVSYAFGAVGFFLAFWRSTPTEALEPVVIWVVGGLGVVSFVRHALLHRSDAARMGWDIGRRNNFQIEVGLANLAWGLVALASVAWDWGVAAQAALTLVLALYLLSAVVLHVISVLGGSESRSAVAAWVSSGATLLIVVLLAYFAVRAARDAGISPFG